MAHYGLEFRRVLFRSRDTQHDIRSAGKTFASVMLGALMMGGVNVSPETLVYDLLANMGPFANPDPRKARITLAHLMTHTPGLARDHTDDYSPGNRGSSAARRDGQERASTCLLRR